MGVYGGISYIKENKISGLVAYFIFCTLGMLAKIPAIAIFSLSGFVVFLKEVPKRRRIVFTVVSVLCVLPVFTWYFVWVPYLAKTFGYNLYASKGMIQGLIEIKQHLDDLAEKFYFSATHSFLATICFFAGTYFFLRTQRGIWRWALLTVAILLAMFIVKTGAIFPTHNYYIIPFVPVIALLAGYGISKVPKKYQVVLLLVIGVEGIANQQHDFFVSPSEMYKLELENIADKLIEQNELVIINGGKSPQDMYFSHRKGWSVNSQFMRNESRLDSLQSLGAKFIVINKNNGLKSHYFL